MVNCDKEYTLPGIAVAHQSALADLFIGSPSIIILADGTYLVSHDFYGAASTEWVQGHTRIYRSIDRGLTWHLLTSIEGAFWSSLFLHRGSLYLLGPDRHFGTVLIRRSIDGGVTWTTPTNQRNGLLLIGEYHAAPVPVIVHNGRIWRAVETAHGPIREWGKRLGAMVISAPEQADLLDAASWSCSEPRYFDPTYLQGHFNGWLEGNVVVAPDGQVVNILRVDEKNTLDEKVALVSISEDGRYSSFDPDSDFIPFPGGSKKFTIRYDPLTRRYWVLSNIIPEVLKESYLRQNPSLIRNTLALLSSADLRHWAPHHTVLHHPDVTRTGFQYIDWQFEGKDIIFASRTAFQDGTGYVKRAHDANYLTFHRITNFRNPTIQALL